MVSERARALGDPTRVRILDALARSGRQPVGRIAAALHCEPSTVSKHLQVLFHARLVERRRDASTVIYSIVDEGLVEWFRYLADRRARVRAAGRVRVLAAYETPVRTLQAGHPPRRRA